MIFSQLVLARAGFIFQKYNLKIIEQQDNSLKLQSEYLVIIIAHNQLENSNTLWLGRNDKKIDKVEIDNETLKSFFDSNLKLSQVPIETFINNLVVFFENEAQPLLNGDINLINELEKFDLERSRKYTHDLLVSQNLAAANKAWETSNYKEFIKILDQIDKDDLPSSYRLKYKIAHQNV